MSHHASLCDIVTCSFIVSAPSRQVSYLLCRCGRMMLLMRSTVLLRPGGDRRLHRDVPSTEQQGAGLLVDACWGDTQTIRDTN